MWLGLSVQCYDLKYKRFILPISNFKAIYVIFCKSNTVIDLYPSENVKFCVWKRAFAACITFLISSKEKSPWKSSFAGRNLQSASSNLKKFEVWFQKFKSGDFDVRNKQRPGRPKRHCKTNRWDLVKQLIVIATDNQSSTWITHWLKNIQNGSQDTVKWFHMTITSPLKANPIKEALKALGWNMLLYPLYLSTHPPFDYRLFAKMGHLHHMHHLT